MKAVFGHPTEYETRAGVDCPLKAVFGLNLWLSDDLEGYKTEAVDFLDVPPGALSDRSSTKRLMAPTDSGTVGSDHG